VRDATSGEECRLVSFSNLRRFRKGMQMHQVNPVINKKEGGRKSKLIKEKKTKSRGRRLWRRWGKPKGFTSLRRLRI